MTITNRDKRALLLLAGAAGLMGIYWYTHRGPETAAKTVRLAPDSIPLAEQRLDRLRNLSSVVPAKRKLLEQAEGELAQREKGLLQAETAAQAQAQLFQILRRVARAQTPAAIDVRGQELGQVRSLGDDYGEATVTITFDAAIDQLVNFLSDLTAQPEILSASEMRIGAATGREKRMSVRLTISGVVPRRLVPDKRGSAF